MFDASVNMELKRLSELFCGFPRRSGQGPTLYPVACAPQAWASGAVFQLVQACLGLHFSIGKSELCLRHPRLPNYIEWMAIRNIRYRNASIDIYLQQHKGQVAVNVLRKDGDLDVLILV
jgi:glycogen debranching enzyme